MARERFLHSIGLTTKKVEFDGLRSRSDGLRGTRAFCVMPSSARTIRKGGFAHETDTVIDIGANIGAFAVYAARQVPRGRVIAFEPASNNYEQLARNAVLNHLSKF